MGRIQNSIELAKSSWNVLKEEKQLAAIPVLSSLATLVIAGLMGGVVWLTLTEQKQVSTAPGSFVTNTNASTTLAPTPFTFVVGIFAYLLITFVVMFFTAAIVAGAYERLSGGDSTLGSSFSAASKRLPQIFLWSMLVGTIGLILQSIEERMGLLGTIVARSVGMAFRVVTFLAVPVIVVEGTGPVDSLKRSATLFKQTWGENLIGQGALGIIGFLAILPGLAFAALCAFIVPIAGIAIGLLWIIVVSIVMAALNGIYRAALYMYAVGQPSPWFPQHVMADAFKPRTGINRML